MDYCAKPQFRRRPNRSNQRWAAGKLMVRACIAILAAAPFAAPVFACEPQLDGELFIPALKDTWDHRFKVPPPIVKVVGIQRGTGSDGFSCRDAGIVRLSVETPADARTKISSFGVYFRVLNGAQPDEIFPTAPIAGPVVDGMMRISFAWLDGAPPHKPLNLRVEAFFVTNDMDIGPSVTFDVRE